MKLEAQLCTLEQAIKLRQLGILQNRSHFLFVAEKEKGPWELVPGSGYEWSDYPCYAGWPFSVNAYTVAELGQMLGSGYQTNFDGEHWNTTGIWGIGIVAKTEAECRAQLLIHLLANYKELYKEVNERLAS